MFVLRECINVVCITTGNVIVSIKTYELFTHCTTLAAHDFVGTLPILNVGSDASISDSAPPSNHK